MKPLNSRLFSAIICGGLPLAGLLVPQPVHAATWQATAGVQSDDMARQGLAFLPNELWIHAGDNITWTFPSDEIHTVSFLTFSQLRPVGPHRNDVITPDVPIPGFDGSSYVNSGDQCATPATCPPAVSNTYTVNFPTAGNFKLVCLVHLYMSGTIHVLSPTAALPHDQAFYDRQATAQSEQLLEALKDQAKKLGHRGDDAQEDAPADQVIAGPGEIVTTGAGYQTASVMRFFPETTTVHVGQTLEWRNIDPTTPHTITFGVDPAMLRFPTPIVSSGVGVKSTLDPDGALHATVNLPTDNVYSGQIFSLPADRAVAGPNADLPPNTSCATSPPSACNPSDLSQYPLPVVVKDVNQRYRVTFTHTGTFNYHCTLHDNLGMLGQVNVVP